MRIWSKRDRGILTVKLGTTDDLGLANKTILQRIDSLALVLDHLTNGLRDELREQLTDIAVRGLTFNYVYHLLSDLLRLRGLGVASDLHLVGSSLGEANGEHADDVTVGGLNLGTGLNKSLPLLNQRLHLIRGE